MSRRVKTPQSLGRDYKQMLKDYFGQHLYGLEVTTEGGQVQAQVIYYDFKHINTVRRELTQMMPEVEFTKLRRDYSVSAQAWVLRRFLTDDCRDQAPVIFVQRDDDTLVKTSLINIATAELRQLELDESDEREICYEDAERCDYDNEQLRNNSWD